MMKMLKFLFFLNCASARMMLVDEDTKKVECSDGNICYHGSICIPLEEGYTSPIEGRSTTCDCSPGLTEGINFYAGYGCEYDATAYCLTGTAMGSGISFCTNGGKCKETWQPAEGEVVYHKGCNCEDGFEGDKCEYKAGQKPYKPSTDDNQPSTDDNQTSINDNEPSTDKDESTKNQSSDNSLSPLIAVGITILVGAILSSAGLVYWKRKKSKAGEVQELPPTPSGSDLI